MKTDDVVLQASAICSNCLGEIIWKDDLGTCKYCGRDYIRKDNESNPFGQWADTIRKIARFRDLAEFEKADELIEEALGETDVPYMIYEQRLLNNFGIVFVKDGNKEKKVPTIGRLSAISLTEHADYQKAYELALASSEQEAINFKKSIEELEQKRKQVYTDALKKDAYDVFVCFKQTPESGEGYTRDCEVGEDVYDQLTKSGYKVFFSKKSLNAGDDYEPVIFRALTTAKVMLVISATKEKDYLNSPWVKNEWSRYLSMLDDQHHLIPVLSNGVKVINLPKKLQSYQAIQDDRDFWKNINPLLQKYLPSKLGDKFQKNNVTQKNIVKKEVAKKTIAKKIIGENATIVLSENSRAAIQSIKDYISREEWGLAQRFIQKYLSGEAEKNAEMNWLALRIHLRAKTDQDMRTNTICFPAAIQDDLQKWLTYSIEGTESSQKHAQEKLDIMSIIAINTLKSGDIHDFSLVFSWLTNYLAEERVLNLTESAISLILAQIAESKNLWKFDANELQNIFNGIFYDVMTSKGTDAVISYFNRLSVAFFEIEMYSISNQYAEKVLELFELDSTALTLRFYNKFGDDIDKCELSVYYDDMRNTMEAMVSNPEYRFSNENDYDIFMFAFADAYNKMEEGALEKSKEIFELAYSYFPQKGTSDFLKSFLYRYLPICLSNGEEQYFNFAQQLTEEYIGKYSASDFRMMLWHTLAQNKCANLIEFLASDRHWDSDENIDLSVTMNQVAFEDKTVDNNVWRNLLSIHWSESARAFTEELKKNKAFVSLDNILDYIKNEEAFLSGKGVQTFNLPTNKGYIASSKYPSSPQLAVPSRKTKQSIFTKEETRLVPNYEEKESLEMEWCLSSIVQRRQNLWSVGLGVFISVACVALSILAKWLMFLHVEAETNWVGWLSWTWWPICIILAIAVSAAVGFLGIFIKGDLQQSVRLGLFSISFFVCSILSLKWYWYFLPEVLIIVIRNVSAEVFRDRLFGFFDDDRDVLSLYKFNLERGDRHPLPEYKGVDPLFYLMASDRGDPCRVNDRLAKHNRLSRLLFCAIMMVVMLLSTKLILG